MAGPQARTQPRAPPAERTNARPSVRRSNRRPAQSGPSLVRGKAAAGVRRVLGVAIGLFADIGKGARISPCSAINHGARIGEGTEIGAQSYVGVKAVIGPKLKIPGGANIPDHARIVSQSDVSRCVSSESVGIPRSSAPEEPVLTSRDIADLLTWSREPRGAAATAGDNVWPRTG